MTSGHPRLHPRHIVPTAIAALAALALTLLPVSPAHAQTDDVARIAGTDRHATAAAVALDGWGTADHVLLATSRSFPDALAATPFAARSNAPILLTQPDQLSSVTRDALAELGTTSVTVLGGPAAISKNVVKQIEALGMTVERIAGDTRYETAAALALRDARVSQISVVALALGNREEGAAFADALAASSLSGLDVPVPVLLTKADTVPAASLAAIDALGVEKVLVLGGEAAVDDNVLVELRAHGLTVERLEGNDRYATAVSVTDRAIGGVEGEHGAIAPSGVVIASGRGFADAMSAGALAARRGHPLLLVPGNDISDVVDDRIRSAGITGATVVGGSSVVADFAVEELQAAVTGQPRPTPPPPPPACDLEYSSPDCAYTYEHKVSTWEALADCESHGNWSINTGNGYYGGIQFSMSSWRAVGGQSRPDLNSKWEQIHRGELLQDRQGWGAWPACTRKLGMR